MAFIRTSTFVEKSISLADLSCEAAPLVDCREAEMAFANESLPT